jgi:hypothetical protein
MFKRRSTAQRKNDMIVAGWIALPDCEQRKAEPETPRKEFLEHVSTGVPYNIVSQVPDDR